MNESLKSANSIAAILDNPKKVLSELTSKNSTVDIEQLIWVFISAAVAPGSKPIGIRQVSLSGTVTYS